MNHFRNAEKNAAYYRKLGLKLGGGVPMFLSTPWGVDVSGFRLAVVGALRPAGGVRRPFPCGPVQATRAGSW